MNKVLYIILISLFSLTIISCSDEEEESTTDTTAPVITGVTAVTTPTIDSTPNCTFSSDEAGTITYGGSCSSSTTSAISGNNTITFVSLSDGTYSNCTITVTDSTGNVSNTLTITSFTVEIWLGTQQFGPMGDSVAGIVLDSSQNIYVAGHVKIDIDGQTVTGGNDFMLMKFNHSGVKQWTKLKGTSSYDQAYGLTIDSSDNLYTFGGYDGANNTNSDMSVVKHDSDGNFLWVSQLDNSSITFDGGDYVKIDSSGNIFTGAGDTVGKFNSSGAKEWQVSQTRGEGIVLDSSGNIYVGESIWTGDNVTLTKYNSSGTVQWSQTLSSSGNDYVEGIAIDSSDNIFITGQTSGDLDGNTNANSNSVSAGSYDAFLIKYDSSGNKQWTKQVGTSSGENGRSVTIDTNGNIYLTGETSGSLDGNTSIGGVDVFLIKYNSSGTKQWTKQFGTTSTDRGVAVATDNSGSVYVIGEASGGFDGNTHSGYTNCGGTCPDMFLIKYNSDGVKQ